MRTELGILIEDPFYYFTSKFPFIFLLWVTLLCWVTSIFLEMFRSDYVRKGKRKKLSDIIDPTESDLSSDAPKPATERPTTPEKDQKPVPEMLYFDYNNSTPLDIKVARDITSSLVKFCVDQPNNLDLEDEEVRVAIDLAKINLAKLLGTSTSTYFFIESIMEGSQIIMASVIEFYKTWKISRKLRPHIIASSLEPLSIKSTLLRLHEEKTIDVTFIPLSGGLGTIEVEDIISAILPETCLICCSLACGITGLLQPVDRLSLRLNKDRGNQCPFLYSDLSQAIGKTDVNILDLGVDFATLEGNKFYGPAICAMYWKNEFVGLKLNPRYYHGHREYGLRPAECNTPLIVGLGSAAETVHKNLYTIKFDQRDKKFYMEKRLKEHFKKIIILQHLKFSAYHLPNTLCISLATKTYFDKIKNLECLKTNFEFAKTEEYRDVLVASKVSKDLIPYTISLSVGKDTSGYEIDYFIKLLGIRLKGKPK